VRNVRSSERAAAAKRTPSGIFARPVSAQADSGLAQNRSVLRLFAIGWLFHVKSLTNSLFFILISVLQPVIFASLAFFMFESGSREGTLLYVALGAGLMGIWSATLFGSGGAIQWQRWQGTLELLVAAPPPFIMSLLPLTIATASIGLYSIVATLAWGRIFFGVPLDFAQPIQLALALPATVLSLGMLGLVLASTFVLARNANAFSNLLEYPVWLATGLLVPLTLLPAWVEPLSWLLAPSWGIRAIREAAFGTSAWEEIGMCLVLGVVYLGLGAFFLRNFERMARQRATLALT
jgi:ABC-type polysaccharide/polyol phosphate export permease